MLEKTSLSMVFMQSIIFNVFEVCDSFNKTVFIKFSTRKSSRSQMFLKIGVVKKSAIFRPATLLKTDSNTGVFF